jgi:predicted DNA-binding transcriptional regulator AlpA
VHGAPDAETDRRYDLAEVVRALAVRMAASEDAVISRPEAAAWLGRSLKTLEAWAAAGFGPRIVRMGRRGVGYRVGELRRWVRQQERDPFSSAADPATA